MARVRHREVAVGTQLGADALNRVGVRGRGVRPVNTVCPACAWTLAVRAGIAAVGAEATRWTDPATEPLGRLLARTAAAIARARSTSDEVDDDPVTVRLLSVLGTHAPVALYAWSCLEGDCDHTADEDDAAERDRPGPRCPVSAVVCPACSLRTAAALDEDGSGFLDECTIPAPCQVLATISARFGVTLPVACGVAR